MATIIRASRDCTGAGIEVWTAERPDSPFFFMGVKDPAKVDPQNVSAAVVAWQAQQATDAKRATIDAALLADLERRKALVAGLYNKTAAQAIAATFAAEQIAEVP